MCFINITVCLPSLVCWCHHWGNSKFFKRKPWSGYWVPQKKITMIAFFDLVLFLFAINCNIVIWLFSVNWSTVKLIWILLIFISYDMCRSGLRSAEKPTFSVKKTSKFRTQHSYFYRIVKLANYFITDADIDIFASPRILKLKLKWFFLELTRTKFDYLNSCTWSVKCYCPKCRIWFILYSDLCSDSISICTINPFTREFKPFTTTTTTTTPIWNWAKSTFTHILIHTAINIGDRGLP